VAVAALTEHHRENAVDYSFQSYGEPLPLCSVAPDARRYGFVRVSVGNGVAELINPDQDALEPP
jgi:hypothetical protein